MRYSNYTKVQMKTAMPDIIEEIGLKREQILADRPERSEAAMYAEAKIAEILAECRLLAARLPESQGLWSAEAWDEFEKFLRELRQGDYRTPE